MQILTVKEDHPGLDGHDDPTHTDAGGVGWQLFGAEQEVVNYLNSPELGKLGH